MGALPQTGRPLLLLAIFATVVVVAQLWQHSASSAWYTRQWGGPHPKNTLEQNSSSHPAAAGQQWVSIPLGNTTVLDSLWGSGGQPLLQMGLRGAAAANATLDLQGRRAQAHGTERSSSSILAEFTEGACCDNATVRSNRSREAVCRFRRSRDLLVGKPPPRPDKFGTTCLAYAHDVSQVQPQYGVLLNVWNAGLKLRVVLTQLIKLTRGPWELIVLFDGCEDDSYQVALDLLARVQSWPKCRYTASWLAESAVWKKQGNWSTSQDDIGSECWIEQPSLVGVRLINTTKVGLHNTAGDNIKMLASRAPFLVLMDDDQFMTVNGWNLKAAYPLQRWPDVVSASLRCAHGFPTITGHAGAKCFDTMAQQFKPPAKCMFYAVGSGNRGPLVLRADYVKQLGYFDEIRFMGVVTNGYDDHDLNYRAYHERGWVSGHIAVDYTEDRSRPRRFQRASGAVDASMQALNSKMVAWFKARKAQHAAPKYNATGGPPVQYRLITDPTWHPMCARVV